MDTQTTAESAIDLFIEYRDKHGYSEEKAKNKALLEFHDAELCDIAKEPSAQSDAQEKCDCDYIVLKPKKGICPNCDKGRTA